MTTRRWTLRVERTPWIHDPKGHDAEDTAITIELADNERIVSAERQYTGMFAESVRWNITIAREEST